MTGSLLVANYQIHKKQIAKTLCENRNKPSKGCQGKCYLKKQLKKAEQAEKSLPGSVKEKMEVAYTIVVPFEFSFDLPVFESSCTSYYAFYLSEASPSLDPYPPRV